MQRLTYKFPTLSLANSAANSITKHLLGEVVFVANVYVIVESARLEDVAMVASEYRGTETMREAMATATAQAKVVNPTVARIMQHKVPMFFVQQFATLRKRMKTQPGSRIMWSKDDQDLDVIPAKDVQGYIKSGWVIIENVEEAWTLCEKVKLTPDQLKQVNQGAKAKILAKKQAKKEEMMEDGEEEEIEVAEAFRFRQQDWEKMRAKYKQGTPVNITLKSGKTVSGTLLRMDKYDQGFATKGHLLHVKTSSGRVKIDDVNVKSIRWNNDPKTKMSEETDVAVAEQFKAGDKVKVPHKGKMVSGKIVRFDSGGTDKARQHGGGYVVDVGEPASILVPKQKVQKEEVEHLDESATKAAIEDFMYDTLTKAAIAELKPIVKNKSSDRMKKIEAVLKKHKIPTTSPIGGKSAQLVADFFDSFHGESVELDESRMMIPFKTILKGVSDMEGPFTIVVMRKNGPGALLQKKVPGRAALPAHINHMLTTDLAKLEWKAIAIESAKGKIVNLLYPKDVLQKAGSKPSFKEEVQDRMAVQGSKMVYVGQTLRALQSKSMFSGSVVKGEKYKVATNKNGKVDLVHQSMGYRTAVRNVDAITIETLIKNKVLV